MTSKHKHPVPPAIPIPLRGNAPAASYSPRTAAPKAVAVPLLLKSALKPTEMDLGQTDPDDLFVRFTIPEIRTVQAKLRAEADAKQEELRLMVGERYRDLLQASTSIISIADSSQRVMEALVEMREAIVPDERQRKPRSSSIRGKDDEHLKILQSLSAHLKLLLDAPEHLWRLLEQKEYLQAAWLFLLARVVHRALITDDPGGWANEGINVLAQFPLVQRQWDIVAQFRPQIAHRATQYLRETSSSSESACSTVLTLHLLDSLPLAETLSTLLSQRSRSLNALLARNLDSRSLSRPGSPIFKSRRKNREVTGMLLSPPSAAMPQRTRNRKDVVKDVQETVVELLNVIGGTMCMARDIFLANGGEGKRKSLVEQSLEDIQSDVPPQSLFTTSSLLSTLPSSTHLLTLPHSILSYKPYIDLASPSAHVERSVLDTKLSTWFDKALQGFEGRMHAWFAGLETIREVWGVRRKVLVRLNSSQGLKEHESVKIRSILDEAVRDRTCEVVRAALDDVEERLYGDLGTAVHDMREGAEGCRFDIMPSTFLLSAPPIPSLSQISSNQGPVVSSFPHFKDALRRRANGRTPLLDHVLSNVEHKAKEIEADLEVMNEADEASWDLRDQVITIHQPVAQASLTKVVQILGRLMTQEMTKFGHDINESIDVVVFLGRISHNMLASTFIKSLLCRDEALQGFQEALNGLHVRSLEHWRTYAISKALEECGEMLVLPEHPSTDLEFTWPSQPSPQLTNAFISLTSSMQRLGLSRPTLSSNGVASRVLSGFRDAIAAEIPMKGHTWGRELAQLLWDLTFLQQLPSARLEEGVEAEDALARALSLLRSHLPSSIPEETLPKLTNHIDRTIDQYLPRSQTLFASFLTAMSPSKTLENGNGASPAATTRMKRTALLPFGAPEADQDFKPSMETVKPSARFGLLLVGGSATIR